MGRGRCGKTSISGAAYKRCREVLADGEILPVANGLLQRLGLGPQQSSTASAQQRARVIFQVPRPALRRHALIPDWFRPTTPPRTSPQHCPAEQSSARHRAAGQSPAFRQSRSAARNKSPPFLPPSLSQRQPKSQLPHLSQKQPRGRIHNTDPRLPPPQ